MGPGSRNLKALETHRFKVPVALTYQCEPTGWDRRTAPGPSGPATSLSHGASNLCFERPWLTFRLWLSSEVTRIDSSRCRCPMQRSRPPPADSDPGPPAAAITKTGRGGGRATLSGKQQTFPISDGLVSQVWNSSSAATEKAAEIYQQNILCE